MISSGVRFRCWLTKLFPRDDTRQCLRQHVSLQAFTSFGCKPTERLAWERCSSSGSREGLLDERVHLCYSIAAPKDSKPILHIGELRHIDPHRRLVNQSVVQIVVAVKRLIDLGENEDRLHEDNVAVELLPCSSTGTAILGRIKDDLARIYRVEVGEDKDLSPGGVRVRTLGDLLRPSFQTDPSFP